MSYQFAEEGSRDDEGDVDGLPETKVRLGKKKIGE